MLCALPGWALSAVLLLPFLSKAFTVDDTVFLLEAVQLQHDPLHPTAFDLVWYEEPERVSKMMASGPVMPYLLYPVVALGKKEWLGHLIILGCLWVAIAATVSLTLRLRRPRPRGSPEKREDRRTAVWAGLLLATTPAVLGLATTVMPDLPALALSALTVERLYALRETRRLRHALELTLVLAAAILTRSQLVLLAPLCVLMYLGGSHTASGLHRPLGERLRGVLRGPLLPSLVVAAVLVMTALRITADPVSGGQVTGSIRYWMHVEPHQLAMHLGAFLSYFATTFPLALPLLALRLGSASPRATVLTALACLGVGIFLVGFGYQNWLHAPFVALGLYALFTVFREAAAEQDWDKGMLCLWLLLGLPVVTYVQQAPKYLVVSAPAICVLVAEAAGRIWSERGRAVLWATGLFSALLGLLIGRADQRFADLGRRAARELIAPLVASGKTVWFAGHWGFQWYAMEAGARPLTRPLPHPQPGDYVVASERVHGGNLVEIVESKRRLRTIEITEPGGRIMSGGAGFFSDNYGYLPWVYSRDPLERYHLYVVDEKPTATP